MRWLEKAWEGLGTFKITHSEHREGRSGDYEIDVLLEFENFGGARFVVLVECKRHKNPIKRDIMMVLNQKLAELGAHKGMVFATTSFQSGAIRFAHEHGISAVELKGSKFSWVAKSMEGATSGGAELPDGVSPIEGWHMLEGDTKEQVVEHLVCEDHANSLRYFLKGS